MPIADLSALRTCSAIHMNKIKSIIASQRAFTGRFFVISLRKPLRPHGGGGWAFRGRFLGGKHRSRRGGSGWDVEWGRLRRPRPHPMSASFLLPGRRKRPHSTQLRPRPYGYDPFFSPNTYPCKVPRGEAGRAHVHPQERATMLSPGTPQPCHFTSQAYLLDKAS